MNSGRNFRARRRAEIEAEHQRQKALAENLEALKAVKSKELRAINDMSTLKRWEYGGKIDFVSDGSTVKFNVPTRFTSQQRTQVNGHITGIFRFNLRIK